MPYAVPGGYFATLAECLTAGTLAAEGADAALPGLPKALPFAVPDGYIASLSEELTQSAATGGGENPIVPYTVPDGYFDSLPATLLAAAKGAEAPQRHARTVAFRPQWVRVARLAAAAAVLVLGLGVGTYRYVHPASPEKMAVSQLSKLDGGGDSYLCGAACR